MKRQQAHMNKRRARGLCEYGGCEAETGDKRRCPAHAAAHAERARLSRKRPGTILRCQCGVTAEDGAPCSYFKSGRHVLVEWTAS